MTKSPMSVVAAAGTTAQQQAVMSSAIIVGSGTGSPDSVSSPWIRSSPRVAKLIPLLPPPSGETLLRMPAVGIGGF
jgi:hypothetical protein